MKILRNILLKMPEAPTFNAVRRKDTSSKLMTILQIYDIFCFYVLKILCDNTLSSYYNDLIPFLVKDIAKKTLKCYMQYMFFLKENILLCLQTIDELSMMLSEYDLFSFISVEKTPRFFLQKKNVTMFNSERFKRIIEDFRKANELNITRKVSIRGDTSLLIARQIAHDLKYKTIVQHESLNIEFVKFVKFFQKIGIQCIIFNCDSDKINKQLLSQFESFPLILFSNIESQYNSNMLICADVFISCDEI